MAWADIVRNPYPHNRRDFKYVWNNYRTGKRQRIGGSELTKNEVIALPTRMYKLLRAWAEMTVAGKSRADKDRPLFFHTRMLGHRGKNRQGLTQTQYLSLWKAFVGQKKIASALKLWKVIPDKFRKEDLNNKRKIGNLTLADWRSIGLTSFYMEWRLGKGPFSWIRPDDLDTFLEHLALVCDTSVQVLQQSYIRVPIDADFRLPFIPEPNEREERRSRARGRVRRQAQSEEDWNSSQQSFGSSQSSNGERSSGSSSDKNSSSSVSESSDEDRSELSDLEGSNRSSFRSPNMLTSDGARMVPDTGRREPRAGRHRSSRSSHSSPTQKRKRRHVQILPNTGRGSSSSQSSQSSAAHKKKKRRRASHTTPSWRSEQLARKRRHASRNKARSSSSSAPPKRRKHEMSPFKRRKREVSDIRGSMQSPWVVDTPSSDDFDGSDFSA